MRQIVPNKVSIFRFGYLQCFLQKNRLLKIWEFIFGLLFLHSREISNYIFSINSFKETDMVLDLGSGDGIFSNWISYKIGCEVIGIERLSTRVKNSKIISKKYSLKTKFINEDLEIWKPNFKMKFDKILMIDCLEHFQNPQKVIKIYSKFLKKGGFLIISTPKSREHRFILKNENDFFVYGNDKHYFHGFSKTQIRKFLLTSNIKKRIYIHEVFGYFYQFSWEISELVRYRSEILYELLVPIFLLMSWLDKFIKVGNGNGLVIKARK